MEVVTILAMGFVCAACFLLGARVGQAASKGEKIETPSVNPMEVWKNRQEKKDAQAEQDRIKTILQNIENYDGTGCGQKDVPGR